MNQTATVHARLDPATKRQAESILKELGMSPTDAVRLLYRQIALRGEFPVELRVPNELTVKVLEMSDRDEAVESFESIEALQRSWLEE
jgi:DNA-damage-inducible protein J